jgi:pimeloyl-ACP methyl ester carboxylesterase
VRPVLLVQGLFATPGTMRPLRRRLRAAGHDVHLTPELSRLVSGDVRAHAEELDRAVERVRAKSGAAAVDVVGASQGGIVALWWATHGGWDRLGRLVGVGAPFRGSPVADAIGRVGRRTVGLRQLVPGSELLVELAGAPLLRPVVSVSLRGDPVCPPASCVLPGMRAIVVEASYGPLSHQWMMLDRSVADAVHRALVDPC